MPPSLPPGTIRIFPAHFQIGDRIADETGEWEVAGHPFTTAGGKNANVRVRLIKQPLVTEIRVWAHTRSSASGGLVLRRASDDATATGFSDRVLAPHLDCDGLRRVRVGDVGACLVHGC